MARITWRSPEALLKRVRRRAKQRRRGLNQRVTAVLSPATDPSLAWDEARRVRERLAAAGLLEASEPGPHRRPDEAAVARARAAAGRGVRVSDLVAEGRR